MAGYTADIAHATFVIRPERLGLIGRVHIHFKYYLQHQRACGISIYKLKTKARVVYPTQRGRQCCKRLVKLFNFIDLFAK